MVAKTGLGRKPLRLLLLVNLVLWSVTALFPLQASIVMLVAGMAVYMVLVPYAEAAEQTILQRVVPYERQGRVFGFAQSIEQAASPLTAFLIGPLTQLVFIPFMTDGAGADVDRRLVRHRTGPRHRAGLRARRGAGRAAHRLRPEQPLLPPAQRAVRRRGRSVHRRTGDETPTDVERPRGDLLPDPASDPRL